MSRLKVQSSRGVPSLMYLYMALPYLDCKSNTYQMLVRMGISWDFVKNADRFSGSGLRWKFCISSRLVGDAVAAPLVR